MKFTISSENFVKLQKRILSVSNLDKSSVVTFISNREDLEVYYRTSGLKGESYTVFYEKFVPKSLAGEGEFTLLVKDISSIKVSDFLKKNKFPRVEHIDFEFTDFICKTSWNTLVDEAKTTSTKLTHRTLFKKVDESLMSKIFKETKNSFTIDTAEFISGITSANIFSTDATNKNSNGCLLEFDSNIVSLVGTDSYMACRYTLPVSKSEGKAFKCVISNSILSLVKSFSLDLKEVEVSVSNRAIYLRAKDRIMYAPTLSSNFRISDHSALFEKQKLLISTLYIPAFVSALKTLSYKQTESTLDTVSVNIKNRVLDLLVDSNTCSDLPSVNYEDLFFGISSSKFELTEVIKFNRYCRIKF